MMIRGPFFLSVMVLGALAFSVARASDLPIRENSLSTKDGLCSIHYVSDKNTTGWYIETDTKKCVDGLADGYTTVVVKNALAQTAEVLAGSFIAGYRTDKIWAKGRMLSRFSMTPETQSFLFQPDDMLTEGDVIYALQFDAVRQKDGFYGAFQACQPVRVFALTDTPELFDDDTVRNQIMSDVRRRVITVCPDAKEVSLAAVSGEAPLREEPFFRATLNFDTEEVILHQSRAPQANIPYPTRIRAEKGITLMRVRPILPHEAETAPEGVPAVEEDTAARFSEAMAEIPWEPETMMSEAIPVSEAVSAVPAPAPTMPSDATARQEVPVLSIVATDKRDDALKLMLLSRVMQAPVSGQAVVRVAAVRSNGEGLTDTPFPIHLKGAPVSAGWGLVRGVFSDRKSDGYKRVRQVAVDAFIPCLTPMCVGESGGE